MRLTGEQRQAAKAELLEILLHGPRYTGELRGTPHFHGERTLSFFQIRTLLRETGKVIECPWGIGMYSSTRWSLKPEAVDEIRKEEERHYKWHKEHGAHLHSMEAWGETLKKFQDMDDRRNRDRAA